jgi:predicted TIM-barrel fold metal-dependent hydrolase
MTASGAYGDIRVCAGIVDCTIGDVIKEILEACIEAFGPQRCMFESNFPVDLGSCDYDVRWNAFKVFVKGYSADEKTALFSGTAAKVYRPALPA